MSQSIDTLLLLALPASGKSEIRRYLEHLDPAVAKEEFHLGPTVQLDDYPYVHLMRRVANELEAMGEDPIFFIDGTAPFLEPLDWGTLIHLLNQDYRLLGLTPLRPVSAASWLFDRMDEARRAVGVDSNLGDLPPAIRERLADALEGEAMQVWEDLAAVVSVWRPGDTVVIEFARGGPDSASVPLTPPYGYAYSLARLSQEIRSRASILYVWVTPEESRRRNDERARPGRAGDASILHHGVPDAVMFGDYGTDDLPWLIERGGGNAVRVGDGPDVFEIPVAVFDNRTDHTSFLRADPDDWDPDAVAGLHRELRSAFELLAD
ncbi:MAG TPA: hypothetical protein VFD97_06510 [Acidimicrobiia bacterium]|nr:hypothetical protein [Acidimicrobiia bacterium]